MLDLRPWNELTVEAMAESIRAALTEAGIHTLAWDHPPSEPTRTDTKEAQFHIKRLDRLYPPLFEATDAAQREAAEGTERPPGEEGIGSADTPR